jgi:hypothetical protein
VCFVHRMLRDVNSFSRRPTSSFFATGGWNGGPRYLRDLMSIFFLREHLVFMSFPGCRCLIGYLLHKHAFRT